MTDRTIAADAKTATEDDPNAPRWLVKLEFASGTTFYWNGIGDLLFDGNTYTGTGRLGSISEIRETQETQAEGIELGIMIVPTDETPDAIDAFINLSLDEKYQGRAVTVYQAFVNPDTNTLISHSFVIRVLWML